jgi:carbonic anhydrase
MNHSQDRIDFESYVAKNIAPDLADSPGIPVVLLTCMDYRYPYRILNAMDSQGLRGKYDQLILAGAALGVMHREAWRTTFWDQLEFAIDHHGVRQLIIVEHRDCGAYREFLGITPDDPAKEKQAHMEQCWEAIRITREKFPKLEQFRCLLLPIETIEEMPPEPVSR